MSDFGRGGRAVAAAAETMGFDDFMSYDPSGGGGGSGFFKWRDQKKGAADVWLHTKRPCIAFPMHNWHRVVEVKDKETGVKELRVFSDRWGCLEKKIVIENQYFRDKVTAERKHEPELCPLCIFAEYCFQQIWQGHWKATMPVFKFEGSRRDEYLELTAGGICGWFTDKRFEQFPGLARECKMARLNRGELWKQKLLTQKKFLFTVVADANPGNGVQTCFEGVSLTKATLKAIEDEKTKEQRKRAKGDITLADPSKHPYRFAWEFDGDRDINSMYSCVALRDGEEVPEDILELITSDPPDVAHLVSEGDCYALRAQMEAHLCEGVEIPWDDIFGPAEETGRMKPPEESKAAEEGQEVEGDEEDPGEFFERKATEIANPPDPRKVSDRSDTVEKPKTELQSAGLIDVVKIGVDDPIWKSVENGGTIPLPLVKGAEVHLDVPEGTDDRTVDKLRGMLEKLGAIGVAEIVPCWHCDEPMTTFDNECSKCGARVDDDGKLLTRPCLKPECSGQCVLTEDRSPAGGIAAVCEKCGQLHDYCEERTPAWTMVIAEQTTKSETMAPRRGRRGTAPPFARPAKQDDDLPY